MLEIVHTPSRLSPENTDAYREALHLGAYIMDRELVDLERYAEHYNNFNVTAVGVFESSTGTTGRVGAANQNHYPGENPTKQCAEPKLLALAEQAGYSACRVMYIRGPWQPDTQTGKHTEALCSCGNCRQHMRQHPLMHDDTVMVHVRPDSSVREVTTFKDLLAFFDDEEGARAPVAREDPGHVLWNSARYVYDISRSQLRPVQTAGLTRSEVFVKAVSGQLALQYLSPVS